MKDNVSDSFFFKREGLFFGSSNRNLYSKEVLENARCQCAQLCVPEGVIRKWFSHPIMKSWRVITFRII